MFPLSTTTFPRLTATLRSNSEQPEGPTDPSVTAAFVEHDQSASVAADGALTVSESQTEKPAHPPWKRLKLGLLKGGASNVMERQ
ncbi:hypothetical protein DFH08DRAFT_964243 [Mycena albidolilacea]|uniref:Uncharacterized protein n=1 Tax=Mycena albidolilacea TaxID=1033008 RepID=A0AAD6ZV19_9AGAR|nr:hypothetical protein DFH08DRAFT_964243 [Mycena albidolilacea]